MTDYIISFDEQWQIGGAFWGVIFSILFGAACDTENRLQQLLSILRLCISLAYCMW